MLAQKIQWDLTRIMHATTFSEAQPSRLGSGGERQLSRPHRQDDSQESEELADNVAQS
jgi:hypothetical protein